jgi:hypothetical protein
MSAWKDFVTAALLGTERSGPSMPQTSLDDAIALPESMSREEQFLTRAGALAIWRRAGWRPGNVPVVDSPAPDESLPLVGRASAAHLRAMLGGRCALVLPEWLNEISRKKRRVPPEYIPALLDRARQNAALRTVAIAAGGERAAWLAAENPSWSFAAVETPDTWETGTKDQRLAVLKAERAKTPITARGKVEAVWKTEPADIRTALLSALNVRLSSEDEAFIESALDDRSKEVRRAAVDLLSRLPESQFVARMKSRALSLLSFKSGGLLSRASLEVVLPGESDAAAIRDGLDSKIFGQQKTLGERAVLLMLMLSNIPPGFWTETFKQSPEVILQAAKKNEFSRAIATGWAWATLRQRDVAWAEPLLDSGIELHPEFLPCESLLMLLPETDRATRLTAAIRAGKLPDFGDPFWEMLKAFPSYWPAHLASAVLDGVRRVAARGIPWHLRETIHHLLLRIPPELLPKATENWPIDQEGVDGIVELLTFRHEALSALQQP